MFYSRGLLNGQVVRTGLVWKFMPCAVERTAPHGNFCHIRLNGQVCVSNCPFKRTLLLLFWAYFAFLKQTPISKYKNRAIKYLRGITEISNSKLQKVKPWTKSTKKLISEPKNISFIRNKWNLKQLPYLSVRILFFH